MRSDPILRGTPHPSIHPSCDCGGPVGEWNPAMGSLSHSEGPSCPPEFGPWVMSWGPAVGPACASLSRHMYKQRCLSESGGAGEIRRQHVCRAVERETVNPPVTHALTGGLHAACLRGGASEAGSRRFSKDRLSRKWESSFRPAPQLPRLPLSEAPL